MSPDAPSEGASTITYFALADCKQLRTPEIPATVVIQSIDRLILEAWRRGDNPNVVVTTVVEEAAKQLLNDQAGQQLVAATRMQRAAAVHDVQEETKRATATVEAQYAAKAAEVAHEQQAVLAAQQTATAQARDAAKTARAQRGALETQIKDFQQTIREKLGDAESAAELSYLVSLNSQIVAGPVSRTVVQALQRIARTDYTAITPSALARTVCRRMGYDPTLDRAAYGAHERNMVRVRYGPWIVRTYKKLVGREL